MLFCGLNRSFDLRLNIGAGQINGIYNGIARKAGLDELEIKGISGHSMRVGAALDLLHSGASMPIIMQRGRWSKTDTVMRYIAFQLLDPGSKLDLQANSSHTSLNFCLGPG